MKLLERVYAYGWASEGALFLKGAMVLLLGPLDKHLQYLAVMILIDLLLGVTVAKRLKVFTYGSLVEKMQAKLVVYFSWIVIFNMVDGFVGLSGAGRNSIIVLLVMMEMLSAVKNTSSLGYGKLADILERMYLSLMQGSGAPVEEVQRMRETERQGLKDGETERQDERSDGT